MKIILIFTMFLSASFVIADDHEVKMMAQLLNLILHVTNPVAFVNSLNMFDKSECTKDGVKNPM